MHLVIVCNRPGLIRGGVRHPQAEIHDLGRFSPAQLRDMLAEPELTLVVGTRLTLSDVDEAEGLGDDQVSRPTLDAAVLRLERSLRPAPVVTREPARLVLNTNQVLHTLIGLERSLRPAPVVTTNPELVLNTNQVLHTHDGVAAECRRGGRARQGSWWSGPVVREAAEATVIDTEGTRRAVDPAPGLVATDPAGFPPAADARPMQNQVDEIAQTHGTTVDANLAEVPPQGVAALDDPLAPATRRPASGRSRR